MKIQKFKPDQLFPAVKKTLISTDIVLDIGCGINPQQMIIPAVHICCEPFSEYLEHLQAKVRTQYDRDYVVIKGSWKDVVEVFPEKSVDTVFLIDVIEHLTKEEASVLLKQTEKIARVQIAIFTPLGFMPQHHDDGKDGWGMNGAFWQEHRSGWLPEDFVGQEWEFFICEDFHTHDSLRQKMDRTYGAMWAIKNIDKFKPRNKIKALVKKLYYRARSVFN